MFKNTRQGILECFKLSYKMTNNAFYKQFNGWNTNDQTKCMVSNALSHQLPRVFSPHPHPRM
jgi:hypothetical protein